MKQDDYSRREFLKKFALLSAGTFVLGATTMACYGPGIPLPSSTVRGMYFLDASLNLWVLKYSTNVPVDATFEIHFFDQMDSAVPATVEFTDQNDAPVPCDWGWDSDFILSVAPSSNLVVATEYRLKVLEVTSTTGEKISLGGEADATFKTA